MCAELAKEKPPRPARDFVPELPPAIDEVLLRCFATDPEARIANVAELAGNLLDAIGSPRAEATFAKIGATLRRGAPGVLSSGPFLVRRAPAAPASSPSMNTAPDAPPPRRRRGLLALTVLLLLIAGGIAFWRFGLPRSATPPQAAAPIASASTPPSTTQPEVAIATTSAAPAPSSAPSPQAPALPRAPASTPARVPHRPALPPPAATTAAPREDPKPHPEPTRKPINPLDERQ
jgi:serine/threonine-protein kinase